MWCYGQINSAPGARLHVAWAAGLPDHAGALGRGTRINPMTHSAASGRRVYEAVAGVADGLDVTSGGGAELCSEAADVDVDGAGAAVVVVAPDAVEEGVAGDDVAGVGHEVAKELVLHIGEGDGLTGDQRLEVGEVQSEVAGGEKAGWVGAAAAAEGLADARDELVRVDRGEDEILEAEGKVLDLVRRNDDDGAGLGPGAAEEGKRRGGLERGLAPVEGEDIGSGGRVRLSLFSAGEGDNVVAGVTKGAANGINEVGVRGDEGDAVHYLFLGDSR